VYVLVAPNFAHNKWRTSDYLPGTEDLRMTVTRPLDGDDSASGNPFPASLITVARDASVSEVSHTAELVYLVLEGECHLRVGRMSGTFGPGGQIHVLRDLDHELTSLTEQSKLLRFECAFVPFAGVPLGPEGAHEQY